MQKFTHEQLHEKIDNNPQLKIKSDEVHAIPHPTSYEKDEPLKLKMMLIYTEAIGCQQRKNAQKQVIEIYSFLKNNITLGEKFSPDDWKIINDISKTYADRKLCHSPGGNDFVCFCDE